MSSTLLLYTLLVLWLLPAAGLFVLYGCVRWPALARRLRRASRPSIGKAGLRKPPVPLRTQVAFGSDGRLAPYVPTTRCRSALFVVETGGRTPRWRVCLN